MEQITQLGISGLTLAILFFIVKYFVSTLDKKDTTIEALFLKNEVLMTSYQNSVNDITCKHQIIINEVTGRYQETVNKYIKDGDENRRMQTKALQDLIIAVNTMNCAVSDLNKKNDQR